MRKLRTTYIVPMGHKTIEAAAKKIGVAPNRVNVWIRKLKNPISFKTIPWGKRFVFVIPNDEVDRLAELFKGKKTLAEVHSEISSEFPERTLTRGGILGSILSGRISPDFKGGLTRAPNDDYLFTQDDIKQIKDYMRARIIIEKHTDSVVELADKTNSSPDRVKQWLTAAMGEGLFVYTVEKDHARIPHWVSRIFVRKMEQFPQRLNLGELPNVVKEIAREASQVHQDHPKREELDQAQEILNRADYTTMTSKDRSKKFGQDELNERTGLRNVKTPNLLASLNALRKWHHKQRILKAAQNIVSAHEGSLEAKGNLEGFAEVFSKAYGNDVEKAENFFALLEKARQDNPKRASDGITSVLSHFRVRPRILRRILEDIDVKGNTFQKTMDLIRERLD